MLGIDLSTFRFDYDLTFCSLLMNADGKTYHVYGGRNAKDAQSHLSITSLIKVLTDTRAGHSAYEKNGARRATKKAQYIEDSPAFKKRMAKGKKPECIHCHSVHDFLREDAKAAKRWRRSDIWIFPDPAQVGISVSRDDQMLVTDVVKSSPAAKAGLQAGDRITALARERVRTYGDMQMVLHDASPKSARIRIEWLRGEASHEGALTVKSGWKEQTPEAFAWRPSKWPLSPQPGFGGRPLSASQKKKHGIKEDAFAFRVQYLVTWGPNRHTGQNAAKAGIRKGDIVYSVCGKTDFESMHHFHAWFRLTQKIGSRCEILIVRGDAKKTIKLPVIE